MLSRRIQFATAQPYHAFVRDRSAAVTLALLALLSSAALAYDPVTNLGSLGQTELQRATGDAVQITCGGMIPLVPQLNPTQLELFNRCGELVHTGNELNSTGGSTAKSLDISADELALALEQVAPEETEVIGAGMTETAHDQLASLQDRLQYLRTGSSTLPIAGIHWSGGDFSGGAAGDDSFSRLGAFLTGVYGTGDRDARNAENGVENGFDFDSWGVTGGVDYRFGESLVVGVGLGYLESEAEFGGNSGEGETEGYHYALYTTYYRGNFYLEATLAAGDLEYDNTRTIFYPNNNPSNPSQGQPISEQVTGSTDGSNISWSLGGGYNWYESSRNYTLAAKLLGNDADVDAYDESGSELAMHLDDQEIESLQSVLSAQASWNLSREFGVLVPFGSLAWHHEFEDESRVINSRYVFDPNLNVLRFSTDPADEDFYLLSLGVNFVLQRGNQVFFNYDTLLGLEDVSSHVFTLGARMEL